MSKLNSFTSFVFEDGMVKVGGCCLRRVMEALVKIYILLRSWGLVEGVVFLGRW